MKEFDVAVVGGGPAGYVAAIRAAQLGASVCVVEKEQLGGTCLNHGCIPTKTLLHNADMIQELKSLDKRGIILADSRFSVDMKTMIQQKNRVVKKLVAGVGSLLKSNQIEVIRGTADVLPDRTILVDGQPTVAAKKIILAGGSQAIVPPIPGADSPRVLTNREILNLEVFPQKMVVIGGGVIGIEISRIFSALGTSVVIVELFDRLVPSFDAEISKELLTLLKREKIEIHLETKVEKFQELETGIEVQTSGGTFVGDVALLATGRKADLSSVGSLNLNLGRGKVVVDDFMQTNLPDIYAAGDLTGRCMLAHAAFKMGEIAAENAMGAQKTVSLRFVPQVLYGSPEAASVGLTETAVKESGKPYRVGRFPFAANGRALAADAGAGFVKIICDEKYGEILGVQMLGPGVSELINEAAALMSAEVTVDELADAIHGHPTCSEALMEAANDVLGKAVHLPKKA